MSDCEKAANGDAMLVSMVRRVCVLWILTVALCLSWAPAAVASVPTAQQIDAYLASKSSPMVGSGAAFVQQGQERGVNPAFIVAIAGAESGFGQFPCAPYNAWGYFWSGSPSTSYFDSWDEGIYYVTREIGGYWGRYHAQGLYSVSAIAPIYCTSGTQNWINNVTAFMNEQGANPGDTRWGVVIPAHDNPIAPGDVGFTKGGTAAYWWSSGAGAFGTGLYTYCNGGVRDCWGRWTFDLSKLNGTALYKVEAYIPNNHATTGNAHYHINAANGLQGKAVNQNAISNAWVDLGTYTLASGSAWVELDDATGETYGSSSSPQIGFDAVRLTFVSAVPSADTAAPLTTISGVPGSWTNAAVDLSLSSSDNSGGSGVNAIYYTVNGSQSTYSGPVNISAEGVTTVTYWAADNAGNTEGAKSTTIRIDRTSPATTDDHVATYAGSATINLSARDGVGGAGVARTRYAVNGLSPVGGSTVAAGGAGAYTVVYWSEDAAGNVESPHSVTFSVIARPSSAGNPSTPAPIATRRRGRALTVSGYIIRHVSGTYPVSLRFYRYKSGHWVYNKSASARVSTILSFSKYSDSTSVPYSGRWRVRARHKVGSQYRYSSYRYFTAS